MHSKRFSKAFGGSHASETSQTYKPLVHVTEYASKNPSEDFAEVFWLFVKHKGKLPRRYDRPAIRRKWQFVEQLRQAILCGQRRW